MNEAQYHAVRGELEQLQTQDASDPEVRARMETLRKQIEAFEAGVRSKGHPDQE